MDKVCETEETIGVENRVPYVLYQTHDGLSCSLDLNFHMEPENTS